MDITFKSIKDNLEKAQFSSNSYEKSISKSKLIVSTYNGTTYLETLNLDIPTICFWNPKHWEINRQTEKYFNNLINVGILHYNSESAAKKVIEIWDNVDKWWSSIPVKKAKQEFTKNFSRHVDNLNDLVNIIKN